MTKTISFDWVQLRVYLHFINLLEIETEHYTIQLLGNGTAQFRKLYEITSKKYGEVVAVIACEPHHKMFMPENEAIIKIINKFIYNCELKAFIREILNEYKMAFMNFVRLDVALDFNSFDNFNPQSFIESYVTGDLLKTKPTIEKFIRRSPTVVDGRYCNDFETVSFGRPSSKAQYRLYNKVLEMQKVKHKPHILDHWINNEYIDGENVWRLEFQLNNTRKGMVLESGEVLHFHDFNILDRANDIYEWAFNTYFEFVYKEHTKYGTIRKKIRSKKVVFFADLKANVCTFTPDRKRDHTRRDKVFLRSLDVLNHDLRTIRSEKNETDYLSILAEALFTFVVKAKGMEKWVSDKLPNASLSDWVVDSWNELNNSLYTPLRIAI